MTRTQIADRLDLIEALLFEIVRRSTPVETIPFAATRIAAAAPAYDQADVAARLGAEAAA